MTTMSTFGIFANKSIWERSFRGNISHLFIYQLCAMQMMGKWMRRTLNFASSVRDMHCDCGPCECAHQIYSNKSQIMESRCKFMKRKSLGMCVLLDASEVHPNRCGYTFNDDDD